MKKLLIFLIIPLTCCTKKNQTLVLSNDSDRALNFKEVIISRDEMEVLDNKLPVFYDEEEQLVATQLEDLAKDGTWDQVVFQTSLEAGANLKLSINWVESDEYPTFADSTQVYMGYSKDRDGSFESVDTIVRPEDHVAQQPPYTYQFEGPGWESNLVAFRCYFDARNGKDIFGKTTEELVVHQIGTGENYHELQDWGMDVLKVGTSLGAGSLALLKNDSLIRLGDTKFASFEKVVQGPIRSVFKLTYKGWDVLGTDYTLEEQITIYANQRGYKSEVKIPGHASDTLITGIVNLKNANVNKFSAADFEILATHGKQSENKDYLGMAIAAPRASAIAFSKAPTEGEGITNTEIVQLKSSNETYEFYFYAGWELEDAIFADSSQFETRLKEFAQANSSSIRFYFE